MILAAHQPNFFPWLGYFAKIAKADTFVFLDEVQFPRTGKGNWVNRVKTMTGGKAGWWTCPISRVQSTPRIMDVTMADSPWRRKALRSIVAAYGKAPHYKTVFPVVAELIENPENNLALFNMRVIRTISTILELDTVFVRQSECGDERVRTETGSRRLAAICQSRGATTYLAGDGADGYEDEVAYNSLNIHLVKNNYSIRPYPQIHGGEFVPGLSILDALFLLGSEETAKFLTT